MKPTKNHYHCPACQRTKMLFESRNQALLFLKYNADAIEQETGKKPERAYYCKDCCGWHLTSRPNPHNLNVFMRIFGMESGKEKYAIISPLIAKGSSISGILSRKIKLLRHNLKYNAINKVKCRSLIDELIALFEIAIGARLENRVILDCLFSKFSNLCSIFNDKIQSTQLIEL